MTEVQEVIDPLKRVLNALDKAWESIDDMKSDPDDQRRSGIDNLDLTLYLISRKIQPWQSEWVRRIANSGMTTESIWGSQGSAAILKLIGEIVQVSKDLERELSIIEKKGEGQPKSAWKQTMDAIKRTRHSVNLDNLHDCTECLDKLVDRLRDLSNIFFNNARGYEYMSTNLVDLLDLALPSRAASLELYNLCSHQTKDCNLDIDLPNPCGTSTYRLFTKINAEEMWMAVVNIVSNDVIRDAVTQETKPIASDLQLFKLVSDHIFQAVLR